MPRPGLFDSCFQKLARADAHLESIKDELREWINSEPYRVEKLPNDDGSWYSVHLRYNRRFPVERWSLIVGDCIHNMRSALDHLVYALAIRATEIDPPEAEGTLMFPICDTPDDFKRRVSGGRLCGISARMQREIEGLQPYHRWSRYKPELLAILRDLDDFDKHRLLRLANFRPSEASIHALTCTNPSHAAHGIVPSVISIHNSPLKEGSQLVAFQVHPPCLELKFKYETTIVVVIPHFLRPDDPDSPVETFTPIVDLLVFLWNQVHYAVDSLARMPD